MRAVILAGGRGTRLAPYSTLLPKPLMPIGDMPILELLIRQLRRSEITRVTLAVGHLASLVMAYCGTGERFRIPIDYSQEPEPLGTAGPLRLVTGLTDTFVVLNGDLLTDVDVRTMIAFHRRQGAAATVGVYERETLIDLGVVEMAGDSRIGAYLEKPAHRHLVSMGVYVFEPSVLRHVPSRGRFDLPDLVTALLAAGESVVAYRHEGYWCDIGRPEDYQRVQEEFPAMKARLLDGA
jgi:NDP-sugar pyrophosphorylase family protein